MRPLGQPLLALLLEHLLLERRLLAPAPEDLPEEAPELPAEDAAAVAEVDSVVAALTFP